MKFNYLAKTEKGEKIEASVEAKSKGEVLLKLQQKRLYVLSITEEKLPFHKREFEFNIGFLEKASDIDLIMFSRQLAILLGSQIGIIESLRVLSEQIEKKSFKEKVVAIANNVEEGEPFSKALEKHGDVFSSFYIGAIESGEASGNLPRSLEYLEKHTERNAQFKSKLIGAMVYPLFIVFVFSFVVGFLLFYVIPDMVEMLDEIDGEMPAITQLVISTSDFFINWGLFVILFFIAFVAGFRRGLKDKRIKTVLDKGLLKLPLLGGFSKKIYLTYFSESMATLVSSGLDVVKALDITENIIGNEVYKKIVAETKKDVKEGKSISASLKKHPQYFPSLVVQMIIVGEKTGNMKKILDSIVLFYRDQIERSSDTYVKVVEPTLIIILGAMVGVLVISILLPIYNIGMGM